MLVLRKASWESPGAKEEFQTRYGRELGCPDTLAQWEQLVEFFHTKKGQTRWGKTFDYDLYGALEAPQHELLSSYFPAYWRDSFFDKEMLPRMSTASGPAGYQSLHLHGQVHAADIQSWGTPGRCTLSGSAGRHFLSWPPHSS